MNKKIVTATGVLTALVVTSASAAPFTGIYAGVKGGWSQLNPDVKTSGTYNGKTPTVSGKGTHNNFLSGVQLGYSALLTNLYLAGEINLDFRPKKGVQKSILLPGVDLKFGYGTEHVVIYANVGAVFEKYKLSTSFGKKEKNMVGFRPGAGILAPLGPNVQIATEYTYIQFGELSKKTTTGGVKASAKIRPNYHTVAVRISYSF